MQDKKIKIRIANSEESDQVFSWRNNLLSMEMSFYTEAPTIEEHSKWFSKSLENKKSVTFNWLSKL